MDPRTRLDAGMWGTTGVGLGYCIAAAVASTARLVVAAEEDSAFGFSAMEVETLVHYQLLILAIIFNNGGVYGGDGRNYWTLQRRSSTHIFCSWCIVSSSSCEAFGGKGYLVGTRY